jgi:hypothetical protein
MTYREEFDNIVHANFGHDHQPVCVVEYEEERSWLGFSATWVAKYDVPEEGACQRDYWQEALNHNLRVVLPVVIDWAIQEGIVDELAESWEFSEDLFDIAETLFVRLSNSHWDGTYCDGEVSQTCVAIIDYARLAMAFGEAYDLRRVL